MPATKDRDEPLYTERAWLIGPRVCLLGQFSFCRLSIFG